MGDFQDTARALLDARAIVQVNADSLPATLARLLADPAERAQLGQRAQEVVRRNQGATERTAEALLAIMREAHHARV